MKKIFLSIVALTMVMSAYAADVLVEAENFKTKGGWCVDQQFMDQMGSPYLIAHGMGCKVDDACTTVDIPEAGLYYVYARTYNWTSPWSDKPGAGAFKLALNGKTLKTTLGTEGTAWMWQYAGALKLPKGEVSLALKDLTGFDGRVDAIYLTTQKGVCPPDELQALTDFRRSKGTICHNSDEDASYDLVVVGGGVAGMCAAVTAARNGLKVALVNDRPVLGGNNSAEIRVHLGGNIGVGMYPELGKMLREFGHSRKGNAQPAEYYEDQKKQAWIDAEKNITLYASCRAVAVTMDRTGGANKIAAVTVRHIETGAEFELSAPLFSDCTGDGTIGFLAGAHWKMGRESRDEFGEDMAPEVADDMTMGASVQWYSSVAAGPMKFPEFSYGVAFDEKTSEKVTMGEWKWENGMNRDQIQEAEMVRDYGLMVVYSNWSFLKNHYSKKAEYANRYLDWVAYVAGKRESRRLLGDYILHQDDIDKHVAHEDASFVTTWSIDLHFPDPANSENFPGNEFKAATKHVFIYPYNVPYRCLYSRNVDNLFMAGRNISVTHVALGTVRVMRTTAMMGEVVGMAASICHRHGVNPRGVYQSHLPELKAMMTKGAAVEGPLPDNQQFNGQKNLKTPKYQISK